jgi:hypothetical protein
MLHVLLVAGVVVARVAGAGCLPLAALERRAKAAARRRRKARHDVARLAPRTSE